MAALTTQDSPARIVADVLRAGGLLLVTPDGIYGYPARCIVQYAVRIEQLKFKLSQFLISLARERP